MLEALFGNKTMEKVLFYLYTYSEGYAQEIRRTLNLPLRSVQLQLNRMEQGGILSCRKRDRTWVFELNPRYPFYRELTNIIDKGLTSLSPEVRRAFYTPRLRPRRRGKPL